jgi:KR domain
MDLNGSVVLVTGANGGLGREFVRQLLERGAAKVYAAGRRPNEWSDRRRRPGRGSDRARPRRRAAHVPQSGRRRWRHALPAAGHPRRSAGPGRDQDVRLARDLPALQERPRQVRLTTLSATEGQTYGRQLQQAGTTRARIGILYGMSRAQGATPDGGRDRPETRVTASQLPFGFRPVQPLAGYLGLTVRRRLHPCYAKACRGMMMMAMVSKPWPKVFDVDRK